MAQAELADGPSCRGIVDVPQPHGIHVIYGFEEARPADATVIYNSANVVAPDGLVGTYRKLHLGIPLETDRFTPGDALPVFQTDLGPIGISICYDFYNNPELCRVLALKGARLLVNPTGRSDLPRAREHLEQVDPGARPGEPRVRRVGQPRRRRAMAHPRGRAAASSADRSSLASRQSWPRPARTRSS